LKQVCLSEVACFNHVPIISEMARVALDFLFRETGGPKPIRKADMKKIAIDARSYRQTLRGLQYSEKCLTDLAAVYDVDETDLRGVIERVKGVRRLPYLMGCSTLDRICTKDN